MIKQPGMMSFHRTLWVFLFLSLSSISLGQHNLPLLPFTIKNTSTFHDEELYVTIVGEDLTGPPGAHIWIDCKTGTQYPMSPTYNTVDGPVYGGNRGPGTNAKYANCFTKLSDVPNKTIMLPPIQGCRVFISKGSQLYFYFFGATGAPSGYTSPSHTDPTDPNTGILYEVIELTYNQYGFWGNTTRVDSYQYAVGVELTGSNGITQRAGELKTHAEIGAAFLASVPDEFKGCYNPSTGAIMFPTKTEVFADGSVGTMPNAGPYVNYMKPYIDAIWAKYAAEDLIFNAGDAGVWKGRVQSDDRLVMVCQSGGFLGRTGIVQRRPTTQEAFEGKGVLDRIIGDGTTDLMVQAQLCAAISRHVVNTTTPNVGLQSWSDPSTFYLTAPCNYYSKFWHQQGISVNQLSYGFAYDDVFNQSSTLHSPAPASVLIVFGAYATSSPAVQSPYGGVRAEIPGTIQAENYDLGGEGLAYHDMTLTNEGGKYRTDAVDIEAMSAGGYNVGYILLDEWMEYMVNVNTTGNYTIEAYVATNGSGKSFKLLLNDNTIATVAVPNTGGWDTWQKVTISPVALQAGQKILKVLSTSNEFNLDRIVFTLNNPVLTDTRSKEMSDALTLYPNPVNHELNISSSNDISDAAYQVIDLLGRTMLKGNHTPQHLDVSSLDAGMYTLILTIGDQSVSKNIVVSR